MNLRGRVEAFMAKTEKATNPNKKGQTWLYKKLKISK